MYNFRQFNQRGIFIKVPICYFDNFEEGPRKQRKSVRTLPSDGNYRGYGENLGRGAIGKSNVESWTWRKLRVIYG
jgi:hypothetical protein